MRREFQFLLEQTMATAQSVTFDVTPGQSHICIEHNLSTEYTFLIFLMVRNPKGQLRFLKQLGYSEPIISIGSSEIDTTIGGVPGELEAGLWNMKVFVFAEHLGRLLGDKTVPFQIVVSDRPCVVRETIGGPLWVGNELIYSHFDFEKLYQTESKWYKGDLHTHTRLSDGKELPVTANIKSKMMGLDYYIPTEHNVMHTGWPVTDVMVVPGIEVTTTIGHANFFGIDQVPRAIESIIEDKEEEKLCKDVQQMVEEARERKWLISINHPFLHIWKWTYDALELNQIDCLEIINDPTYEADPIACAREANEKAVMFSDMLWDDGYRICAIGGSDSHNFLDERYADAEEPSIPGDPATWLYMNGLSPEHMLESLEKCHSYVTRHCQVTTNLMFGSKLPEECQSIPYEIKLEVTDIQDLVVFYIHNRQKHICQIEETEQGTYQASGEVMLTDEEYQWVRFGAETKDGAFVMYGNPITKGSKSHTFQNYGEIKKRLEELWKSRQFYLTKTEQ